jgi:hypothetical protein
MDKLIALKLMPVAAAQISNSGEFLSSNNKKQLVA